MPGLLAPPSVDKHTEAALQVHPKTGEVYIRLPAPNNNIILTPPRTSDADGIVEIMNDERVALKFSIPPYPYLHDHAVAYLKAEVEKYAKVMSEISSRAGSSNLGCSTKISKGEEEGNERILFSECPVQSIREVRENGEEIYIGEARIARSAYLDVRDEEESIRMTRTNLDRPVGDPEILWTFSDYLAPSHHGKGIMSAAIKGIMDWAVPNMGVHHIMAIALPSNMGSIRVFEKNGFAHVKTVTDHKRLAESRGGQMYSIYIMEWRRPTEAVGSK